MNNVITTKVILIDEKGIKSSKDLVIGMNTIKFEGLKPEYEYAIIYASQLNLLDNDLKSVHLLNDVKKYTTGSLIDFSYVLSTDCTVKFGLRIRDKDEVGKLSYIALLEDDIVIEELTNFNIREFSNLLSNHTYKLKVIYTYDLSDGMGEKEIEIIREVKTKEKNIPMISFTEITTIFHSIYFDLDIIDLDGVGNISSIGLYHDNKLIQEHKADIRSFDFLLTNNQYVVKVIYQYDLNDGNGIKYIEIQREIKTEKIATPTIAFGSTYLTKDSIGFALEIVDDNVVGEISNISLYKNNELIESLKDLNLREFYNLLSNTIYEIKVTYQYDLNDGEGSKTLTISKSIKTEAE